MTTDQKGAIAETAIIHAAVKLGISVFRPVQEGLRYDLIFEVEGKLLRVQCKWASRRGDVIAVRSYSSRRTRAGFAKLIYTPAEIDALAAYCPDIERCFLLPLERFKARTGIQLRLGPTRNNQQAGINWADDYAFESLNWLANQGP